jgi:hypothetical protein
MGEAASIGFLTGFLLQPCRAAAPLLARHVESSLSELAMGGARFSVTLTWQPEPQVRWERRRVGSPL